MTSAGERFVAMAKMITGSDSAALWSQELGSQPRLRAATDPVAAGHLSSVITTVGAGAEWDCLHTGETVRVHDLRTEGRWPAYRLAMLQSAAPTLSMTAFPFELTAADAFALVLASGRPHHFTEDLLTLGAILTDQAAVSLSAVRATERSANLERALTSNRRIGVAIGVIMERHRCTDDHAFGLLRNASQGSHRKLHEVAEDLILTGVVPGVTPLRPVSEPAASRSA
jgi:hypothetical protein